MAEPTPTPDPAQPDPADVAALEAALGADPPLRDVLALFTAGHTEAEIRAMPDRTDALARWLALPERVRAAGPDDTHHVVPDVKHPLLD